MKLEKILLGFLLTGFLALSGELPPNTNNLDLFLTKNKEEVVFKKLLYNVRKIEEYLIPSSVDTLIYIRQRHLAPNGEENLSVSLVQKNILNILEKLKKENKIRALYVEGLTKENEKEINEQLSLFSLYSDSLENYSDFFDYLALHRWGILGASAVFSIKEGIILHASETNKMNQLAIEAVLADPNTKEDIVLKNREDFLIKKINKDKISGKGYVIFIYGAAHDFRDNVDEWNRKHLNKQHSLIVITPDGIAYDN